MVSRYQIRLRDFRQFMIMSMSLSFAKNYATINDKDIDILIKTYLDIEDNTNFTIIINWSILTTARAYSNKSKQYRSCLREKFYLTAFMIQK